MLALAAGSGPNAALVAGSSIGCPDLLLALELAVPLALLALELLTLEIV